MTRDPAYVLAFVRRGLLSAYRARDLAACKAALRQLIYCTAQKRRGWNPKAVFRCGVCATDVKLCEDEGVTLLCCATCANWKRKEAM